MSEKNNLLQTVGERIKELRGKISREKLEEDCDLPSNCIRQIENGPRKTLDISVLCTLAEYFDVDPEYLLGLQECKRRDVADASKVTGLSYEAVEVLKKIDHLYNIDLFHALSAFICSPSFIPLMVQISNYCKPDNGVIQDSVKRLNITYSEIINASIQKYVSQSLEDAKKQTKQKMAWFHEVLPFARDFAGNLSEKERKEGKLYSDEQILNEIIIPLGFDEDGTKLFMDLLSHYRNRQAKEE